MSAIVELRSLTKHYGDFIAVNDVSIAIERGEVFGLLGPNGAGKTTTIKMMMGMLCSSSGEARIAGYDCFRDRAEVMRHVGYLPDEPVFYDYLRGSEMVRFVGEMHGFDARTTRERAAPWIERFELAEAIEDYVVNYSRGMKKKLGLLLAMLPDPDVLLLDEPTNGLDPYATRHVHQLVRERGAQARTVIFSTHLLEQAQRLCVRIGILHRGKLVGCGTVDELCSGGRSLEDVFFQVTGGLVAREVPPSP